MQDKEFDKFFNSKFKDFKIEPSSMVWDNIANELNSKKVKGPGMPWLSIAASIIVLITAGILFLQQKAKPIKQRVSINKVATNHIKPATTAKVKTDTGRVTISQTNNNKIAVTVKHRPSIALKTANTGNVVSSKAVNKTPQTKPVETANQPLLAVAETHEDIQNIIPDKDAQLIPKLLDTEQQTPNEKPAAMATVTKYDAASAVKRRGIHNLGGLVNALISTVDKRQDKLIEFSDSDDDDANSSLTGVNLGLIKVKKQ